MVLSDQLHLLRSCLGPVGGFMHVLGRDQLGLRLLLLPMRCW